LQASIPALVSAQNRLDAVEAAMLVTIPNTAGPPAGADFPIFDQQIALDRRGRLNLPAPFDRPDLVVFHSTYIPAHAKIASLLSKAGIPYIVCPRGGMTRNSQANKRLKKRIGNLLFFNYVVSRAVGLHYLTEGESKASVPWKLPQFVVGNGVEMPDADKLAAPGSCAGLQLLFVGRLHVLHKGLDVLLEACAEVGDQLRSADARLDLHGPDYFGSAAALIRQIKSLGLQDIVEVHGPVVGEAKTELLRRADVFLHPSRSEGHPSALLEAIAHGLPCLLTANTNMAEQVTAAGAGWQVEPSVESIAEGLQKILACDRKILQAAGANARQLAVEQFDWTRVADQCVRQYQKFAA